MQNLCPCAVPIPPNLSPGSHSFRRGSPLQPNTRRCLRIPSPSYLAELLLPANRALRRHKCTFRTSVHGGLPFGLLPETVAKSIEQRHLNNDKEVLQSHKHMLRFFLKVKQLFSREGKKGTQRGQPLRAVFQSRDGSSAARDLIQQKNPVYFEALQNSYEIVYKRPKHKIKISQSAHFKNQEFQKREEAQLNMGDENNQQIKNQMGLSDPHFPTGTKVSHTERMTVQESVQQSFIKMCLRTRSKKERSIDLSVVPLAYGYYFPLAWSEEQMLLAMDPSRKSIVSIVIVRDAIGTPTGKVAITFQDHSTMDKFVGKYDEDFLTLKEEVYRVVLRPFVVKTALELRQKKKLNLKHPLKVTNLDFEMPLSELQRLAADFGVVEHIDMPLRSNQNNMGFATIYMGSSEATKNLYYFMDELIYNERTLKAQIVNKPKVVPPSNNSKAFQEQMPKFLLQTNQLLIKKEAVKDAQRILQVESENKKVVADRMRLWRRIKSQ